MKNTTWLWVLLASTWVIVFGGALYFDLPDVYKDKQINYVANFENDKVTVDLIKKRLWYLDQQQS